MARKDETYFYVEVESYLPTNTSGLHGKVHIRPLPGQADFAPRMHVACSEKLKKGYPVGTKFLIKGKITDLEGGNPYIYSHYNWTFEIIERGEGPIVTD